MNTYGMFNQNNWEEGNKIHSAKEYITRKKKKSARQTHKGIKKEFEKQFNPGGNLYVN